MAKWMIWFSAAGLLGAAVFYSPYIGIDGQTQLACLLCPHVTMGGVSNLVKFIRLTIGGELLNAVSFMLVGWIVLTIAPDNREKIEESWELKKWQRRSTS